MATKPRRPRDTNQLAKLIVDLSTGDAKEQNPDEGKSTSAIARGRKGGLKGGKARMGNLDESERKALALKAARARWTGQK